MQLIARPERAWIEKKKLNFSIYHTDNQVVNLKFNFNIQLNFISALTVCFDWNALMQANLSTITATFTSPDEFFM